MNAPNAQELIDELNEVLSTTIGLDEGGHLIMTVSYRQDVNIKNKALLCMQLYPVSQRGHILKYKVLPGRYIKGTEVCIIVDEDVFKEGPYRSIVCRRLVNAALGSYCVYPN